MKSNPLLSICIAVFNLEKYIEQCLDSVLNQSFKDYEILLIDNGSTDGSIDICEQYAKKYNKIKYTKFELPTVIGRPFVYARNNYSGRYFMVLDGDDYLVEGALQNIADAIEESNYADLIMGSFICDIEPGMTNFKDAVFDEKKINHVPYKQVLNYLTTLPNFHTFQWRFVLNRQVLDAYNGIKNRKLLCPELNSRFNDAISVTTYLIYSKSIWFVEKPFYVYRKRKSSLSDPERRGEHAIDFFKTFMAIAKNTEKELRKENTYKKKYIFHMLKARFEMFRELMFEISDEKWYELGMIVEKHKSILSVVKDVSRNFKEFHDCIKNEKNIQDGLNKYREVEKNRVMLKIEACYNKKVFVFPAGMCGESMCILLKEKGINVEAFLDNDALKIGKMFEEKECRLPKTLQNEENIKQCCVFIATAYEKNIEIMKNQLVYYGILEENIKIR